jgi:hypothetical protein
MRHVWSALGSCGEGCRTHASHRIIHHQNNSSPKGIRSPGSQSTGQPAAGCIPHTHLLLPRMCLACDPLLALFSMTSPFPSPTPPRTDIHDEALFPPSSLPPFLLVPLIQVLVFLLHPYFQPAAARVIRRSRRVRACAGGRKVVGVVVR